MFYIQGHAIFSQLIIFAPAKRLSATSISSRDVSSRTIVSTANSESIERTAAGIELGRTAWHDDDVPHDGVASLQLHYDDTEVEQFKKKNSFVERRSGVVTKDVIVTSPDSVGGSADSKKRRTNSGNNSNGNTTPGVVIDIHDHVDTQSWAKIVNNSVVTAFPNSDQIRKNWVKQYIDLDGDGKLDKGDDGDIDANDGNRDIDDDGNGESTKKSGKFNNRKTGNERNGGSTNSNGNDQISGNRNGMVSNHQQQSPFTPQHSQHVLNTFPWTTFDFHDEGSDDDHDYGNDYDHGHFIETQNIMPGNHYTDRHSNTAAKRTTSKSIAKVVPSSSEQLPGQFPHHATHESFIDVNTMSHIIGDAKGISKLSKYNAMMDQFKNVTSMTMSNALAKAEDIVDRATGGNATGATAATRATSRAVKEGLSSILLESPLGRMHADTAQVLAGSSSSAAPKSSDTIMSTTTADQIGHTTTSSQDVKLKPVLGNDSQENEIAEDLKLSVNGADLQERQQEHLLMVRNQWPFSPPMSTQQMNLVTQNYYTTTLSPIDITGCWRPIVLLKEEQPDSSKLTSSERREVQAALPRKLKPTKEDRKDKEVEWFVKQWNTARKVKKTKLENAIKKNHENLRTEGIVVRRVLPQDLVITENSFQPGGGGAATGGHRGNYDNVETVLQTFGVDVLGEKNMNGYMSNSETPIFTEVLSVDMGDDGSIQNKNHARLHAAATTAAKKLLNNDELDMYEHPPQIVQILHPDDMRCAYVSNSVATIGGGAGGAARNFGTIGTGSGPATSTTRCIFIEINLGKKDLTGNPIEDDNLLASAVGSYDYSGVEEGEDEEEEKRGTDTTDTINGSRLNRNGLIKPKIYWMNSVKRLHTGPYAWKVFKNLLEVEKEIFGDAWSWESSRMNCDISGGGEVGTIDRDGSLRKDLNRDDTDIHTTLVSNLEMV